jgi:MFS family permease
VAAAQAAAALRLPAGLLGRRPLTVLGLTGLAAFFVGFDGSVLILALPAIAADFHASVPELTDVGSALQLGALAGLPLAMAADRVGRRRLLAGAVLGFSLANVGSAAAPGLGWLTLLRLAAVAFETVAAAVAVALVVEEVEPGARGLAVAALTVAGGLGTGLTTLLYPLLAPRWRLLYLLGAVGLLAGVALARLLPESRAWAATEPARVPLRVLLQPRWRLRLGAAAAAAALGAGLVAAAFGGRR